MKFQVTVRVGTITNQAPRFLEVGGYQATVAENAQPGHKVVTVTAEDPDGEDSLIRYSINETNNLILSLSQPGVSIDGKSASVTFQ